MPFDQSDKENTPVLIIGSHNVFEVDCTVEACKIGDNNIFESKCYVGNKLTITNGCIIGAGCRLTEEQTLKDNTIVYGRSCLMREGLDRPVVSVLFVIHILSHNNRYYYCTVASNVANGYTIEDAAKLSPSKKTK